MSDDLATETNNRDDMYDDLATETNNGNIIFNTSIKPKKKGKRKSITLKNGGMFVNRDRNAALNILLIGKAIASGEKRPQIFCHKKNNQINQN